ncbi:transmembrane emp24 domain-containing protein 11 [Triplophysa rosa]|uniref:Transmembrane emp24 domain-containing protein 11-like n=1 Tax=Triplophysa rosa TaxID=992332 RepID=A0A9W7WJP5_TRIRA|nr:transmembrane emp24 domain-containing protein 11 [Triplophysa rosa]KAI7802069.1 putative transmembrane emp24 domain-containing protein 11-like [Triplophysa rosa]
MNVRLTSLLLTYLFILAPAMYFDLGEQEEKCVIEEIPEDTLVTGILLLEYWDENRASNPHLGLTVSMRDPQHEVILLKRFGRHGKFTLTSHASGQHFLCVQSNSTRFSVFAGERLKVHLDVQMGKHTLDPNAAKAKDTMKAMEYNLQHLIDQMWYISRQQDFQREREETFRQMSEETNGNVLWWAIIQTSILLSVGFWQMKSLKDFLIEKKLV